jgi:hypothetical protein
MNTPLFTAEASLYRTSERYHAVAAFDQANGTIHPAQCDEQCLGDCYIELCSVRCSRFPNSQECWLCRRVCWNICCR